MPKRATRAAATSALLALLSLGACHTAPQTPGLTETILFRNPHLEAIFNVSEARLPLSSCKYEHKVSDDKGDLLKQLLPFQRPSTSSYPLRGNYNAIYVTDRSGKTLHALIFDKSYLNMDNLRARLDGKDIALSKAAVPVYVAWLQRHRAIAQPPPNWDLRLCP